MQWAIKIQIFYRLSMLWSVRKSLCDLILYVSSTTFLCKTCDPGAGPSLAPGYNLNKLGRGPLNIKALDLVVSEKNIF